MSLRFCFLIVFLVFFTSLSALAQAIVHPIRVACVGNSITFGSGVENRVQNCYPNQLQQMLGCTYQVHNFGVSGSTLLNLGDKPYAKEGAFRDAIAFKPEILIIKLGTNDSKPQNWDDYKTYFERDYKSLISSFRKANPEVKIFICLPVPVYGDNFGIREKVVKDEILPLVRKIAEEEKTKLIDLFHPMLNHPEWFPDKIHPNAAGARQIAELVFAALK
jgi:lysophospholipase L1-like esterase